MGINIQSSVTKSAVTSVTDIVNETITTLQQQATQGCNAINNINIVLGGKEFCGVATSIKDSNFNVNQTGVINCTLKSEVYSNISQTTIDELKTKLEQEATKSFENKQGWLAVAASIQSSYTDFKGTIKNNIRNILSTTISNTCQQKADIYNTGTFTICADIEGSNFNINQNGSITTLNQCVTTSILTAIFNNSTLQDIAQKTDEKFASDQEGIGSLFKWLVVIAVIVAVVVIVGIIIYAAVGGFSSKPEDKDKKGGISTEELMLLASSKGKDGGGGSSLLPLLLAQESKK